MSSAHETRQRTKASTLKRASLAPSLHTEILMTAVQSTGQASGRCTVAIPPAYAKKHRQMSKFFDREEQTSVFRRSLALPP